MKREAFPRSPQDIPGYNECRGAPEEPISHDSFSPVRLTGSIKNKVRTASLYEFEERINTIRKKVCTSETYRAIGMLQNEIEFCKHNSRAQRSV